MDETVREQLAQLIAEHGRSLCTTPRVVSMMLRQHCPDPAALEPINDIELALTHHCVAPLLTSLPELADVPALTKKFVEATGLSEERARWAIGTWIGALCREKPETSGITRDWSQWNRLDVGPITGAPMGTYRKSIIHLLVVAAAGAFGATTLGWLAMIRPNFFALSPWAEAVEDLPEWAQGISVLLLGALGGGAGGLLGWIIGGGRSWTYDAYGTTTLGRLYYSASGAYFGANIGVLGGLAMIGLMGATLGGLLGAVLGAWMGQMTAERISRYWYWG
jgi:hypothetical protein